MRSHRRARRALGLAAAIVLGAGATANPQRPGAMAAPHTQVWAQTAVSPDLTPTPPPGSGPEYTSYDLQPSIRNRFFVGGLLALLGIMMGGLLLLERRQMAALAFGGVALAAGVALMLSEVI